MATKWTPTIEQGLDETNVYLPESNRAVIVITPGGDERELYFSSNLWFLPDRSMYVYFTPTFWRYK